MTDTPSDPWRPIQYLGSKLRSIPDILKTMQHLEQEGTIVDLFSGTTVVSQGMAKLGYRVIAADVAEYTYVFAKALLGIGRTQSSALSPHLDALEELLAEQTPKSPYFEWARQEAYAIEVADGEGLVDLSNAVPQRWRRENASPPLASALDDLDKHTASGRLQSPLLIQTHYAGTYFGVTQAIDLDLISHAVGNWARAGSVSSWEHAALLTALLHAASKAAFSAGKHFAQPHKISGGKRTDFIKSRIVSDRRVRIIDAMRRASREIEAAAPQRAADHTALRASMESLLSKQTLLEGCSAIYADPPYTAQQYSRFYHVLEVILKYEVPVLQTVGGNVTSGLYPRGRFKSRFCSKTRAPAAFRDLCRLASQHEAHLLISYSASKSSPTGNSRMISLHDLLAIIKCSLPERDVETLELSHSYRQFNSAEAAYPDSAASEFLVVAPRC